MELEGFQRCLKTLNDNEVQVTHVITDRHVQIRSFLKKFLPQIRHYFDVWHVAKSTYRITCISFYVKDLITILEWSNMLLNQICLVSQNQSKQEAFRERQHLHICDLLTLTFDLFLMSRSRKLMSLTVLFFGTRYGVCECNSLQDMTMSSVFVTFGLHLWPSSSVKVTFTIIIRWPSYYCMLIPSMKFVCSIEF